MAGRSLATAWVTIRPKTDGFESELKKNLGGVGLDASALKTGESWGKNFARAAAATAKLELTKAKFKIPAEVDIKKAKLPKYSTVKIPVEFNTKKTEADLKFLLARLSAKYKLVIPVTFNSPGGSPIPSGLIRSAGAAGKNAGRSFSTGFGSVLGQLATNIGTGINPLKWLKIPGAVVDSAKLMAGTFKELWSSLGAVGTAAKSLGPILSSIFSGGTTIGASGLGAALSTLSSALAAAVPAASAAIGALALIPALLAAIIAAAGAAAVAVNILGGALGALPAFGIGFGAGIGALALGFSGIADRFKQTASGGGGAAKSMSGVRNATYALTVAQRELAKSTVELNKARVDEVKRIADLQRSLRDSALDEEAAAGAVADARTALADARSSGDVNQIGKADLALRQSLATLDDAKAKTADLQDQKSDADKKGVEGSDAVQSALDSQRDATERVAQAQAALADAQNSGGGGGGAGQALEAIAPAAQAVVDELKRLKPAFDNLRLDVQQRLFAGIAPILGQLAGVWFPPLHKILGETADSLNGLFKNLAKSVSKPKFISDIVAGFESVKDAFAEIGTAITGPLVGAFGTLARASGPVVKEIADEITDIVTSFSSWIEEADKSGALKKFFQDAARYMHELYSDGKLVVEIAGQVIGIFLDSRTKGGAKPVLENIHDRLQDISDWLKDPKHQKSVKDFIDKIGDLIAKGKELTDWMVHKGIPDAESFISTVKGWVDKVTGWIDTIKGWKNSITSTFDSIVGFVGGLGARIDAAAAGMWFGIYNSFRTMINGVITAWNSLYFAPKVATVGAAKGSGAGIAGSLKIPHLAAGGVVQARPGGTTIQAAEAGEDEAVTPIETLKAMIRESVQDVAGAGGDIVIPVYIGQELVDTIVIKAVDRRKATVARSVRAGNKQLGFAG